MLLNHVAKQQTYLFYDIETSGLNKCFDQVLQFAAVRTDLELNELERHEILIKLNPDTVPSPHAIITHKLSLEMLERGIPEYEAMLQIHKLLNMPGTISLGYNTLGFDDEFLRFSFYRNLLPPYTHQYANGCGRMDIYPITVAYYLYKPEVLNWSQINNINSLKLEHLNAANEFTCGTAHEAMADVEVVIELTRALKQSAEMWDYLRKCFDKKIDLERSLKLTPEISYNKNQHVFALLLDGCFGAKRSYQCPALCLGMHNHYLNQSLWLVLDSPELAQTTCDSIATTTKIYRKRFGEPPLLLPKHERFLLHLSQNRKEQLATNLEWLRSNPELLQAIIHYYKEYKYPVIPNLDVDAALYQNGFLTRDEQLFCDRFHAASLNAKIALLEKFPNNNLRMQALRLLGRNYFNSLPKNYQDEFVSFVRKAKTQNVNDIMVDYRNEKRLTPITALAQIAELRTTKVLSAQQHDLLNQLEKFIT